MAEEQIIDWPYRPDGIQLKEDITKSGKGIITDSHVRRLQTEITLEIKLPVIFFELTKEGTLKRLGASEVNAISMCHYCLNRRTNKDNRDYMKVCERNESLYALLINSTKKEDITEKRILDNFENNIKKKIIGTAEIPRLNEYKGRKYIDYNCPIIGLIKAIFPIIVEGRVLGVLMTGQMNTDNTILSKFKSDELYSTLSEDDKRNFKENAKERWLDDSSYKEKIDSIFSKITTLEETLKKHLERRRKEIAEKKIQSVLNKFENELNKTDGVHSERISDNIWGNNKNFWGICRTILEKILQEFAFEFYVVYALDTPIMTNTSNYLKRQICFPDKDVYKNHFPARITREKLKAFQQEKYCLSSRDDAADIDNILDHPNSTIGCDFRLVYVNKSIPAAGEIIIAVGYSDENPIDLHTNLPDGLVAKQMILFNNALNQAYMAMMFLQRAKIYELQLRYFSHEMGHLSVGFNGLRHLYLIDRNPGELSKKDFNDFSQDLAEFTSQICVQSDTGKYLIDSNKELEMIKIEPYGDLLFKWRKSFLLQVDELQKSIPTLWKTFDYDKCPPVLGNQKMLEQVVYNLLTNAIKYSHRGSNIYFSWKQDPENPDLTIFSVTDYGIQIDPFIDIYELYKCGKTKPGSGLGLFISKKVAYLHNGTLSDNGNMSEPISQYHIPLLAVIHYYLQKIPSKLNFIDRETLDEYKKEINRLHRNGIMDRVVAMKNHNLVHIPPLGVKKTNEIFNKRIRQKTYEVTFNFGIPRYKGKEEL